MLIVRLAQISPKKAGQVDRMSLHLTHCGHLALANKQLLHRSAWSLVHATTQEHVSYATPTGPLSPSASAAECQIAAAASWMRFVCHSSFHPMFA